MKKQIFKNLFSNYIGNFLSMLLGILIIPFLIGKLGKEAFGISVLAESIIAFFQIFAFSIRMALARHAAIALATGNKNDFNEYLATGRFILNIAATCTFIVGSIMSLFFSRLFNVPAELFYQAQALFLMIVVAFSITIPNVIYWSVLYAHQRFDLINYSNFGGMILRAIAIFILFNILPSAWQNLVTYGVIYLVMTWGQNYIIYFWHKEVIPDLKINIRDRNAQKYKELVSFGGYSSIAGVAAIIYESAMNVVINLLWGPAFNALYSVSIKIPSVLKRLLLTPASSLSPTFAAYAGTNDYDRLRKLFLLYSKAINLVVIPVALLLMVFAKPIFQAWLGPDFASAAEIMPLFLVASILSVPTSICNCVNNAFGKIRIPAWITLVSSIISISLGILLGFNLGYGLPGIAIAAIILNSITFAVCMPIYSCKLAGIPSREYFTETLIKPLFLVVITWGLFSYALLSSFVRINLSVVFIFFLIPIYALISYKFVLNTSEKIAIKDLVTPFYRKLFCAEKIC